MQLRSCANHSVTSRTMFSSGLGRSLSPGEAGRRCGTPRTRCGWVPAHRVGRCEPCGCMMLPVLLRHGSTQAATVSPPLPSSFQPPRQRFLVLNGEKMLKLLAKWAKKHRRGDKSQEGGYPGDGGGVIFWKRHEDIFWWLQGEYLDEKSLPSR